MVFAENENAEEDSRAHLRRPSDTRRAVSDEPLHPRHEPWEGLGPSE
jgi:hypothetical protein